VTLQRFAALACVLLSATAAAAQLAGDPVDLDHPAIAYRRQTSADRFAQLIRRVEAGETAFAYEGSSGYLRSLLRALDIPIESQILVYSKTSLQSPLISPSNPRAIYFNDSVVVAWVRGGFIEIAAQDPSQGPSFYVLPQAPGAVPRLQRDGACLGCHYSANADGVPGLFVRSIPTTPDGRQMPWLGNAFVDHATPLADRWGGWYVTGTHGTLRHLGNLIVQDALAKELPPWSASRTLSTVAGRFNTDGYLTPHSDIVALLLFEHQMRVMNLLTRAGWEARILAAQGGSAKSPSLDRTIAALVDYFLFVGEAPLDGVRGSSGFAEHFSARGPRDSRGRSLRQLDLGKRLMKYPCSYMLYSEAFDALPAGVRGAIYGRMKAVLTGTDRAPKYAHLTASDRQAVLEILRDTKQNLPAGF
jgi:hypothetical protein